MNETVEATALERLARAYLELEQANAALTEERDRLREALQPFADKFPPTLPFGLRADVDFRGKGWGMSNVIMSDDFRKALVALAGGAQEGSA